MKQRKGYSAMPREEVDAALKELDDEAAADRFRAVLAMSPLVHENANRVSARKRMDTGETP